MIKNTDRIEEFEVYYSDLLAAERIAAQTALQEGFPVTGARHAEAQFNLEHALKELRLRHPNGNIKVTITLEALDA